MNVERWSIPALLLTLTACAESTEAPVPDPGAASSALLVEAPTTDRALAPAAVEPVPGVVSTSTGSAAESPAVVETVAPVRLVDVVSAPRTLEFGAVGIQVAREGAAIVVREVYAGMPADAAGIEPNSRVLAVDGMEVADMTLEQFVALVRGEPGTSVELTIATEVAVEDIVVARESLTVTESRCERLRRVRAETEFGGIGMRLESAPQGILVRGVEQGMPADLADLSAGDQVISVDGMVVDGAPLLDVIAAIRGAAGTTVTLGVRAPAGPERTVELERVAMVVPPGSTCTR